MKKNVLIIGDGLAIAMVTLLGFATHGESSVSFLPRMAAAFLPMLLAWFLVAPWLGMFDDATLANPRLLWRPALAMLFAGPLAIVLRGLILNASVIPIFVVVFSSTSALGIMIWRAIYFFFAKRATR